MLVVVTHVNCYQLVHQILICSFDLVLDSSLTGVDLYTRATPSYAVFHDDLRSEVSGEWWLGRHSGSFKAETLTNVGVKLSQVSTVLF